MMKKGGGVIAFMIKLTGFCIVLFAVLGLINDYSKRKKADIAILYYFMLLIE